MPDEDSLAVVFNLAAEGFLCSGEQHKQWYLEEILKVILGEQQFIAYWEQWEASGRSPKHGVRP